MRGCIAVILSLPACRPAESPVRAAGTTPIVELVAPDSATGEDGASYVWYRVAVRTAGHVETLPGIQTHEAPIITPDGVINGLAFDSSGEIERGYQYDSKARRLQFVELPSDMSVYFSEALLSPDAQYLAYIAQDSLSIFTAVIIGWPDGRPVFRQRVGAGFPSDVNFNHLRWLDGHRAEFAIRIDAGDGPWVHIVASLPDSASVDTLTSEPDWPQRGS